MSAVVDPVNSQIPNAKSQAPIEGQAFEIIDRALAGAEAPCITSSFQAECVVLTHLLLQRRPDIPVLFLDTFHHFPQTLAYRDELSERWGLRLITLKAAEPAVGAFVVAQR